ncbi:fucose mutarotase isoform X3 [Scyliorhinus torazame]|uniref:fucose mutarotase isoform X3 n=1 Tax=Scyliorhinus torazame TaxID=75743 RepID=UPI003B5A3017
MVTLRGIPSIISPDLLYALAKMGHGDEIGLKIPELLKAILKLFPLDTYVSFPAAVMALVHEDEVKGLQTPVWDKYMELLSSVGFEKKLEVVERFKFYERAKNSFAVVATGETALYGNLILRKGVIPAGENGD